MDDSTGTRAYYSPVRSAEAAATRGRILDAAAELFAEQGYAITTMKDIAERADVSIQTAHNAGPKSAILLAAFARRLDGVKLPKGATSLPPRQQLLLGVKLSVESNERTATLWHALEAAAHADPNVRCSLREAIELRNRPLDAVLDGLGLDDDTVAEIHLLLSAATFLHLVTRTGWSLDRFRTWLEERVLWLASV